MPIVLRHQAAGIAPDQENPRTKYGMAMVLQQQRAGQEMRQRAQDAQYDMQRMGAMGAMREMREPSIGEDDAMLEQEIRSGLYDPDTVRALRQDQRTMRQIMRDTNIDGTQRAQALGNLQSRMRMSRSTGKVQPMMQQMGPAALQTKPPMTEADYFSDEKNYANAYAAAQARLEAAGPGTPATPENIQAQMHNDYLARQKFLEGLRQPQNQDQPTTQPPNTPTPTPTTNPQTSYTNDQSTFSTSPIITQNKINTPINQNTYQPTKNYTSPEIFSTTNILTNPASQQYAEVLGGNRDTQYSLQNPQMSAGQAYFDPNNPVRQEMSAADQSIVNPQKETLGKPGGRYGLGMVDYGINPATGNRVTASIRPGGTMPEYDEPVGTAGTAMGGRRGSLNYIVGKKKPATQRQGVVGVDVSPELQSPAIQINPPVVADVPRDNIAPVPTSRGGQQPKYGSQPNVKLQEGPAGVRKAINDFVTGRTPGFTGPIPQGGSRKIRLEGATAGADAWSKAIGAAKTEKEKSDIASIQEFAASQSPEIASALASLYDTSLSEMDQVKTAQFLIANGVDLRKIKGKATPK